MKKPNRERWITKKITHDKNMQIDLEKSKSTVISTRKDSDQEIDKRIETDREKETDREREKEKEKRIKIQRDKRKNKRKNQDKKVINMIK